MSALEGENEFTPKLLENPGMELIYFYLLFF